MEKSKSERPKVDRLLQWIQKLFVPCRKRRIQKTTVAQLIDMSSSVRSSSLKRSVPVYSNAESATPDKTPDDSTSEYGFTVYSNNVKENSGLCDNKTDGMDLDLRPDQMVPIADVEGIDKWLYNTYSQYSHVYEEIASGCQVRHSDWNYWSSEHTAVRDFMDPCGEKGFGHPSHLCYSLPERSSCCLENQTGFRHNRRTPLVDAYHITPLTSHSIPRGDPTDYVIRKTSSRGAAPRPELAEMQRLFQLFLKDLATGRRSHIINEASNGFLYRHHYEEASSIVFPVQEAVRTDGAKSISRKNPRLACFTHYPSPPLHF